MFSLLFIWTMLMGQTPGNIQTQVFSGVVTGTTPPDPNAYTFHENTNT